MLGFLVRRLLQLPFVLFAVSLIIVGLLQLLTPAQRAAAFVRSEQQLQNIDQIIEQYNLDENFVVQYTTWLKQVLQGNLGFSTSSKEPVLTTIKKRLPVSAELALYAFFPIVGFGIWLGTLAAVNRDKLIDQLVRILAIMGWSLPTFVFGIWLLAWVYGGLGLFGIGRLSNEYLIELAAGGFTQYTGLMTLDALLNGRLDIFWDALMHLVMPVLTLTVVSGAQIMRVMRSSLLDELGKDYVRTARAKGLSERVVNLKHARRNALIPVITLAGLMFAFLLNGVVVTETIFNYPGIGQWAAQAAVQLDVPAVLGFAMLTAVIVVLANILVDILYAVVDPRIRYD
ncbi:ABC transporter permease [Marinithermus hydrothermalis]|uniref:ABC-type transporter, integral membrane subunit n=1 Tax=Marinithermus hydrothermalis (strain DSM 14884 / JCM 11576 / T1) TaxID=869210 RepID=F2NNH7_MARHT|nr:ABC transporter permease [Marinithermus hydrothermalis]AEB10787.1 ABC-type transporter, integral membrane subunit [Marinithermus hydrothermalis DSM 14884]